MNRILVQSVLFLGLVVCLFLLAGCQEKSKNLMVQDNSPLSIEAWQELEISNKYAPETLERLRQYDSKLKDDKSWDRFMRDVIVPQRRIDIPTNY